MINSFIELIKEANDVSEMGVKNVERLTGSNIGRVKQKAVAAKSMKTLVERVRELLKAIKPSQITMVRGGGERKYYPTFQSPELIEAMQELNRKDPTYFTNNIGKWKDLYPNDSDAIYMKTDSPDSYQRSHFPNDGIPVAVRGIGLGVKLYRALVSAVGYISSNTSGTTEKDRAWASLIEYKPNPDGTPAPEDVHSIIGSGSWMALDKNMNQQEKIDVAINFIMNKLNNDTKPNKFDMDDELFALLPDHVKSRMDQAYLQSLVTANRITQEEYDRIESSRDQAERLERERLEAAAAAERKRLAERERQTRKRLIARIAQYGADPDAEWDVGDYIVVKQYLYQADYADLPIRHVEALEGGTYKAVGIEDAMRIANLELTLNQVGTVRTTTRKTDWVKVNLDEIPDLDNVNLNRREKEYIEGLLNPETISRQQAERDAATQRRKAEESEANAQRATSANLFGLVPSSGSATRDMLVARPQNPAYNPLLKAFKSSRFTDDNHFIFMGPPQRAGLRSNHGIPIFVAWSGSERNPRPIESLTDLAGPRVRLTNVVTGQTITGPFSGLGLTAYPLSEVEVADKIGSRAGHHFYIAGHQNTYGVVAKSDYGAVNTNQQRFIYLKVYGYSGRSVSVRLDLLRKLGAPIEV